MLRAILNKSWRKHPTRQQLYGHRQLITKIIKVRRSRHAGHCGLSRDELISDVLLLTPSHGKAKDDQLEPTYSSSVPIRDIILKTCQKQWTIGRGGERGSGISVLIARRDDDLSINNLYNLEITTEDISSLNNFTQYNVHIHHHHHHVVPLARISLTLSRNFSLSFIAYCRSSGLHPVSSHSCRMYVRAGRPAFTRPYVGVHGSISLMSSSLLLQQCPACLVCLTCIVFMMGGR